MESNRLEEIESAVGQLIEIEKQRQEGKQDQHGMVQSNSALNQYQSSIVEWQLDLSKEFELIYHQLRGHILKRTPDGKKEYWANPEKTIIAKIFYDDNGIKYWVNEDWKLIFKLKNKDEEEVSLDYTEGKELYQKTINLLHFIGYETLKVIDFDQKLLNEKGAQEIEKIIRNYLNKNVLLSNFDEKVANQRVYEFSHRLRRFIFLNYEEFGLDTYYKQKHFEMIVMGISDIVEAAYNRAINGGERESLTTIRQVIQQENMDNREPRMYPTESKPKGSRLNPLNWGKA